MVAASLLSAPEGFIYGTVAVSIVDVFAWAALVISTFYKPTEVGTSSAVFEGIRSVLRSGNWAKSLRRATKGRRLQKEESVVDASDFPSSSSFYVDPSIPPGHRVSPPPSLPFHLRHLNVPCPPLVNDDYEYPLTQTAFCSERAGAQPGAVTLEISRGTYSTNIFFIFWALYNLIYLVALAVAIAMVSISWEKYGLQFMVIGSVYLIIKAVISFNIVLWYRQGEP
ncbi:unnamed protein product [Cyprideis torosa]|uniref:Uncharacterized protein n=1 Tax=Cyprideis torosa TaxID=163714 RepID=A0A7R8WAQ4_9CRUS|nr:unnamed protein product [Cyprideis torosa]CAG0891303.1 unnamed protein product [Cyprideis torosa]